MRSPASRAVQAVMPKLVIPKWWRTGRKGNAPVIELDDLVEPRNLIATHQTP
jgi:hypothetical protein